MNIHDIMTAHMIKQMPTELLVDKILEELNKWKENPKDEHICTAVHPMMMLVAKHEIGHRGVDHFLEKTDEMRKAKDLIVDHKKPERSN